jgi:beta-glucosidase
MPALKAPGIGSTGQREISNPHPFNPTKETAMEINTERRTMRMKLTMSGLAVCAMAFVSMAADEKTADGAVVRPAMQEDAITLVAADVVGIWKYRANVKDYEREFHAAGTIRGYEYAGPELPWFQGYNWKIDGDRIVARKPGAKEITFRLLDKNRLEFTSENLGVAVRDTATVPFPRSDAWWQTRHAQCSAQVAKGGGEVLFIGDSITHGWDGAGKDIWNREIAPLKAANLGFSGDHTENVLWRLENGELPAACQPKVAVVMIGTNNTGYRNGTRMESPAVIAAGITAIVDKLHAHNPNTRILLLGIFPRGATAADPLRQNNEAVNRIIAKLDGQKNVQFLDIGAKFITPDGALPKTVMGDLLHPNAQGYRIWADAVLPEINKALAE